MVQRITPTWLRPVTAGTVVLLHASVLLGATWPEADPPAVAAPIAVQVVPMGQIADTQDAPQQAQVAEVTAMESPASNAQPAQAKAVEPPKPIEPLKPVEQAATTEPQKAVETKVAEAPVLVPEAAIQASEKEKTALTPAETVEAKEGVPQPRPRPKRRVVDHKPNRHERAKQSAPARARSQANALARRSNAREVTGSIASANYRSMVAAELNRRKFYPPSARAAGAHGVVVVTFTVGANGRVARHAIRRSSGRPVLDRAVHRMMAAVSLPPPPGGHFRATVPIRFDINR